MTAAVQTSGLTTNPQTGKDRLLAALRWLVTLLLVHCIIVRGRALAAALAQPDTAPDDTFLAHHFGTTDHAVVLARVTNGLRRAADFEAALLAAGPADPRLADIAHRRANAAVLVDIGRDLGFFRARPAATLARKPRPRFFPLAFGLPAIAARSAPAPVATGPPEHAPRPDLGDAETAEITSATRVHP